MRVTSPDSPSATSYPAAPHPRARSVIASSTNSVLPKETNAFGLAAQGAGSAVVLNLIFWCALVISIPLNGFKSGLRLRGVGGSVPSLGVLRDDPATHARPATRRSLATRRGSTPTVLHPDKISELLGKVAGRITLLINNRRTLWWAFAWAGLNWLLDAACLWVFVWSFGTEISPIDLLVAYGLANIFAAIPVTRRDWASSKVY